MFLTVALARIDLADEDPAKRLAAVRAFVGSDDPQIERVRRGIHLSINGLAAGLRNTG